MKQILQNLANGELEMIEAPPPVARAGHILVDTSVSLISIGTERMLVDFGKAGLIAKARQQPDKVKQVLEKARTDGALSTFDAVRSKLGQPLPLGYSNVGTVRESRAEGFAEGDRVVSNGPHADAVSVPRNLAARIPDEVSDEAASFTVVASIGLQGIRLAAPTLGEAFVVTGVGLIGLLTVQMLRAQGCRVLAIDFDQTKLELARAYGAETCNPGKGEDPVAAGLALSRGAGVDGVIITASTKSSDPVAQAAKMCRKRGRIVLVGVTGLDLDRSDFYEKELSFQVSCSYGPGRYDPEYEEKGNDYPIGFVRWTEQRNFEAVLDMMASGAIDTSALVTHRFDFDDARSAYETVSEDKSALGIILRYPHDVEQRHNRTVELEGDRTVASGSGDAPRIAFIGAGNYASRVLIPAFRDGGAALHAIASSGGTSAALHGQKHGFAQATSDVSGLLADQSIDAVAIATRHDSHARLTIEALDAGKHVFVEKPLALNRSDVDRIEQAHSKSNAILMVGFNRRFAPHVVKMKSLLEPVSEPKSIITVMNAGAIPVSHWTQDPDIGGGRIIGEACHHVDLVRFLVGSPIISVQARRLGNSDSLDIAEDKAVIVLGFADGSFGTIHYLANGSSAFPKERVEVFAGRRTLQLDNFIRLKGYGWPGFKGDRLWRQDKGQAACAASFVNTIRNGGASPIPAEELFETARATIDAGEQLRTQT